MALQDKVAQAWLNFARTGNPSQPGLEWKPYTKESPQAMVFDTVSQSVPLRTTSWYHCCRHRPVRLDRTAGRSPGRRTGRPLAASTSHLHSLRTRARSWARPFF